MVNLDQHFHVVQQQVAASEVHRPDEIREDYSLQGLPRQDFAKELVVVLFSDGILVSASSVLLLRLYYNPQSNG